MRVRAFVAIELPDTVKAALETVSKRLRSFGIAASWVRPEQMHLTLRFLGDVEQNDLRRLSEGLVEVYRGGQLFDLTVRGLGAFPNMRRPTVIWVGLEPLEGRLTEVQVAAESAAQAIGLAPETRSFQPHLTLARIRDPRTAGPVTAYMETESAFEGGVFTVRGVSLFSSQLTRRGAIHQRLEEFVF